VQVFHDGGHNKGKVRDKTLIESTPPTHLEKLQAPYMPPLTIGSHLLCKLKKLFSK
jgi:hypothetical protein